MTFLSPSSGLAVAGSLSVWLEQTERKEGDNYWALAWCCIDQGKRCPGKMRVPTLWSSANRKGNSSLGTTRPFSLSLSLLFTLATLSLKSSCDITESIHNTGLILLSASLSFGDRLNQWPLTWPLDPNVCYCMSAVAHTPGMGVAKEGEKITPYLAGWWCCCGILALCQYSFYLLHWRRDAGNWL